MSGTNPFSQLLATPQPAELGPGPRPGIMPEAELNRTLDEALPRTKFSGQSQQLIRALILLWHDHLEAAHVIAQGVESADGAFVHGIVHRREPDYQNAAYWFRRVGAHPAFAEIARRAGQIPGMQTGNEAGLVRDDKWDSLAFIAACESAAQRASSGFRNQLLRQLQQIETEALLDWLCERTAMPQP